MGLIYGQRSPEEAIMKVTTLADSIAPCVLFIDELEKALAGSEAGASDPTAIKVLGLLLTWMQERTAPVFIVATANDISMIRPETYRDGRIDEKFFLGFLEETEQIKQIIDIHLKIRLKDHYKNLVKPLDFKLIHRKMDQKVSYYGGVKKAGYAGANMEALVAKVLEERYFRGKEFVETKDFIRALETVRPQHGPNISTMLYRAKEMDAITA
jgi:SpoVK/Ycf46/Vps4 family AAA+-type ATPase